MYVLFGQLQENMSETCKHISDAHLGIEIGLFEDNFGRRAAHEPARSVWLIEDWLP
jgi:hypothetical protein